MKKIALPLIISTTLFTPSFATSLGQSTLMQPEPIQGGTRVVGSCRSTREIAMPSNAQTMLDNVSQALTDTAAILQAGEKTIIEAEKNAMNQALQALTQYMQNLEASTTSQEYINQTLSDTANAKTGCAEQDQAAKTAGGLSKAKDSTQKMAKRSKSFLSIQDKQGSALNDPVVAHRIQPVSSVTKQVKMLNEKTTDEQWDSKTLFDPEAKDNDVAGVIAHMVAPLPTKGVPEDKIKDNTTTTLAYKAKMAEREAKTSLLIDAMATIREGHQSSIEIIPDLQKEYQKLAEWKKRDHKDKTVSAHEKYVLETQMRFANEDFMRDVQVKTDAWQLREQVKMLAAMLWANQREIDLLERAVAIEAMRMAEQTNHLVNKANEARAMAVGQQARQE